jgi:hypothetical protein
MNPNKIAFIYLYNDQRQLDESLDHLSKLTIPEGIEVEVIKLDGQTSMCSGYNKAMKMTDAKYKVYLHQDTNILNLNFIADTLAIFKQDSKIALLGVIGAKRLNQEAVWWFSDIKVGQVFDNTRGTRSLLQFNEPVKSYEKVEALDGLILVTQYDTTWRSDVFGGWHFYDISQCQEFIRKGLHVVIPKQVTPWCYHNCNQGEGKSDNSYDLYRMRFMQLYNKRLRRP